jgi:hypothetical protein
MDHALLQHASSSVAGQRGFLNDAFFLNELLDVDQLGRQKSRDM